VAREYLHEHGYDALDDDSVGVGSEYYVAVCIALGVEPHAALAAFDEAVWGLQLLGECRQRVAHVDDIGIFVHPVVDVGELVDNILLAFVNSHFSEGFFLVYNV
jgi:hypothetical protein